MCQFLAKSVKTFESESKISLRKCLQRCLTSSKRKDSTMIVPPNEDDNFSISAHFTSHHSLKIFFLFPTSFDQFGANYGHSSSQNYVTRQITLRSNYFPVNCATNSRGFFSKFFSWFKFCLHLKAPARNRTENWEPSEKVSWRQLSGLAQLCFRVHAESCGFKTRKTENKWTKKKDFWIFENYFKMCCVKA